MARLSLILWHDITDIAPIIHCPVSMVSSSLILREISTRPFFDVRGEFIFDVSDIVSDITDIVTILRCP
jgi:hypothetical protein